MTLLPDSASFHERVQALFVAFRGSGVSLSGTDLDLLNAWAELDVPFEVVARGIRKAAEAVSWDASEGSGLRSLRSCRLMVDREIAKYLKRSVGSGGAPTVSEPYHLVRFKRLVAAVTRVTGRTPPAWLVRLKAPQTLPEMDRLELRVLLGLLRLLPFERRLEALREARRQLNVSRATSPAVLRETLRLHRSTLARHAWDIPSLW